MAKRGQHSFLKRQKEIGRKEQAAQKMARRQGKAEKHKHNIEEERAPSGIDGETHPITEPRETD